MGGGQRIQLYCVYLSINKRTCRWCLEYAAVWLAENTFLYGADNRSYKQPTTKLCSYAMYM